MECIAESVLQLPFFVSYYEQYLHGGKRNGLLCPNVCCKGYFRSLTDYSSTSQCKCMSFVPNECAIEICILIRYLFTYISS